MRAIEIDTEVFSKIWAHRIEGEESENDILRRLLGAAVKASGRPAEIRRSRISDYLGVSSTGRDSRVRWRDDVRQGLEELGGTAPLADIYARVRSIRRSAGRSLPPSTDDIVRRELENNSSDSHAFMGQRDWFMIAEGKGAGIWALRA